jgi:hypothetical protein
MAEKCAEIFHSGNFESVNAGRFFRPLAGLGVNVRRAKIRLKPPPNYIFRDTAITCCLALLKPRWTAQMKKQTAGFTSLLLKYYA